MSFLLENAGTIVISLAVVAAAFFAGRSVYRNKKRSGCLTCSCGGCHGNCHEK